MLHNEYFTDLKLGKEMSLFDGTFFENLNKDKLYAEMKRLLHEPPKEFPKKGDRVVVAIGLLSRGHLWTKAECRVLEVGDSSIKVECKDSYHDWQEWIHPALITDILKK